MHYTGTTIFCYCHYLERIGNAFTRFVKVYGRKCRSFYYVLHFILSALYISNCVLQAVMESDIITPIYPSCSGRCNFGLSRYGIGLPGMDSCGIAVVSAL